MKLKVAFSPWGEPSDGVGPFNELFNKRVSARYLDSLSGIDAVILWGGEDIAPILYAEKPFANSGPAQPTQRDLFELELCRQAHAEGKAIIGVCRGAQFICAFAGGKLVQNVTGHRSGTHNIATNDGKLFNVTSCHHQMMYPFGVNHELIAWSDEHRSMVYQGCDEAASIKEKEHQEPEVVYFPDVNGYGVQCHPEWHNDNHLFNRWMMEDIQQRCFGKN